MLGVHFLFLACDLSLSDSLFLSRVSLFDSILKFSFIFIALSLRCYLNTEIPINPTKQYTHKRARGEQEITRFNFLLLCCGHEKSNEEGKKWRKFHEVISVFGRSVHEYNWISRDYGRQNSTIFNNMMWISV